MKGGACSYIYFDGTYHSYNEGKRFFYDYYHVMPNHRYVIFIDEPISSRFRAHFYAGKNYTDDFEYYVNNNMGDAVIYTCTTNITGELTGSEIRQRFYITPSTEGEIVILTSNLSLQSYPKAYCIKLT